MMDIFVVENNTLLVARPTGILDAEMAESIVDFIEIKEAHIETGFNRFCDLTRLDGIHLSLVEVLKLAVRRRAFNPNDFHVKSAFLAADALGFGIASMYEQLLNSPRIEVRVWSDLQSAANWLGVKADILI